MGTKRKIHNDELGYIAERTNPFSPGKVVIYIAEKQGIDVYGNKYAVVCDARGTIAGTTSIPDARILMKNPFNFCEECQKNIDFNMEHGISVRSRNI